jgi:hypothetical protein
MNCPGGGDRPGSETRTNKGNGPVDLAFTGKQLQELWQFDQLWHVRWLAAAELLAQEIPGPAVSE